MMICGKPGSGKTTLVQRLVESEHLYKDKFDRIIVVSPSIGKMGFTVPKEFCTGEFDLEWIFDHIHSLNLKQEQLLMNLLRSDDEQSVLDTIRNK
jgi:septin family protein